MRGVGYLDIGGGHPGASCSRASDGTPVTVGDVAELVQSHTPRRGAVGWNRAEGGVEGFVLLRRGENPSRGARRRPRQGRGAQRHDPAEGHADRAVLRPHATSSATRWARCTTTCCSASCWWSAVVWLFLRSVRGSLIVASVIPLALLAAFIGLYALGLPANLISMGAIDFGILVDGAVVLVENVLHDAAARAAADAARACCGSSSARPWMWRGRRSSRWLIIIAALIPVFTLQRVEGRIFRPLALTYSFALLGALVFALTLVPALCAVVLRPRDAQRSRSRAGSSRLRVRYRRLRRRGCSARARSMLAVAAASPARERRRWRRRLGTEFLPELDEGDFVIFVEMPPSIALESGADHAGRGAQAHSHLPRGRRRCCQRAGTPRGRHRQRGRQHERDLRAPAAARANGARATTRTA